MVDDGYMDGQGVVVCRWSDGDGLSDRWSDIWSDNGSHH